MQISNCGRVVLIDDNYEEIMPLMKSLGREGIPYYYYDGDMESLPFSPLKGIRFVFLDIELKGMHGLNESTIASALIARLERIISINNGPYFIIFWTKHDKYIKKILQNCKKKLISPINSINLDKSDCLSNENQVKFISETLHQKLLNIGAFRFYVEWENVLNTAGKKFINSFSNLVEPGDSWSKQTSYLLYKLYKTYVDKNELNDVVQKFRCACHLMNRSFLDTLESETMSLQLPDNFLIENGTLPEDSTAKLNTSLYISNPGLDKPLSSYVYLIKNIKLKKSLENSYFKENRFPKNKLICIIITPECDLAQNKTLKTMINGKVIHRVVYGLILEYVKVKPFDKNLSNKAIYKIQPIWHEKKRQSLIINFATISYLAEDDLINNPIFSLKRDLLFDLLANASNHVNRLGNFLLD